MKPKDTQENFNKCICPGCEVYQPCNREKNEKLFCGRQKSGCKMDTAKMCICGSCPVWSENNLGSYYFCQHDI